MKPKMMKIISATCAILLFCGSMFAQSVGINTTGDAPNSKAMLDVSSTSKGFLPPRMTIVQRNDISTPPAGLMIWCSNCGASGEMQVYNGTAWTNLIGGSASGTPGTPTIGTVIAGNAQASVPFTAPASNGGSTITSYTATSSPGSFTGTLTQAGSGTITVTGLANGTAYTFTVTATNAAGTSAASDPSNQVTTVNSIYSIGQSFQGGKIFYIDGTGEHGLIAATVDQSTGIAWITGGSTQSTSNGNTSTALGTGQANTNYMKAQTGYTGGAAKVCDDYSIIDNSTTYSDWFLPSKDELNKLYLQKALIGGFANDLYWCSSEGSKDWSWCQNFSSGEQESNLYKSNKINVRAIRSF